MKKRVVLIWGILTLGMLSTNVFAWAPTLEGKPIDFKPGVSRGYFVWHDSNGVHVWTTTRGQRHVFSGVIKTDGEFFDVSGQRKELDDFVKIGPDKHRINFDFDTSGGVDGINFRVREGQHIQFELYMDGRKVDNQEIYGGREGWHPDNNVFELLR